MSNVLDLPTEKHLGLTTLLASKALEEALCFGWIDGQMQSLDNTKYKKYFARRTISKLSQCIKHQFIKMCSSLDSFL